MVAAAGSLVFHQQRNRTVGVTEAFDSLKNRCLLVGTLLLLFSTFFLVADLGRPERVLTILMQPSGSVISVGALALFFTLLISLFLVAINYFYLPWASATMKKVFEVLCIVGSLVVITYPGILLPSLWVIPFWDTITVPVLFVLSSLSTGIALVFCLTPFTIGATRLQKQATVLRVVHVVVLVAIAIALALYLWSMSLNAETLAPLQALFSEDLIVWFVLGVCVVGIVLSTVFEIVIIVTRNASKLLLINVFSLVGAFCLRYCIITAGLL